MTARCVQRNTAHTKPGRPSMEGRSRDRPMDAAAVGGVTTLRALQWRGGHVTARCLTEYKRSLDAYILQWRGGHVTARCPTQILRQHFVTHPSMEGRSRDRPMP